MKKMKKIIKINANVKLNQENPTPSRKDRDIAINVIPATKEDKKKIENFVLAISNYQSCCEEFAAGYYIANEKYKDVKLEDLGIIYLENIELDITLDDDVLIELGARDVFDVYKNYFAVKLNTNIGEIYACVYNEHNGYYSHIIYYSNGELKLDVLEEDWL